MIKIINRKAYLLIKGNYIRLGIIIKQNNKQEIINE
jgi:hypothetical protein